MEESRDMVKGFDLMFDNRMDRRAFSSAHTTKIVHTEEGAYALLRKF